MTADTKQQEMPWYRHELQFGGAYYEVPEEDAREFLAMKERLAKFEEAARLLDGAELHVGDHLELALQFQEGFALLREALKP